MESLFSLMTEFIEKQELLNWLTRDPRLAKYGTTELQILQSIGKEENPNVTQLSAVLHLSKGMVSKTVKKLTKQGLLRSYKLFDNRQKIFYSLTDKGEALFKIYAERGRGWEERNAEFMGRLSEEELRNAEQYLRSYVDFLGEVLERCDGAPKQIADAKEEKAGESEGGRIERSGFERNGCKEC